MSIKEISHKYILVDIINDTTTENINNVNNTNNEREINAVFNNGLFIVRKCLA